MERVEFEQEQMVEELKEFEKKGIFSKEEVKEIMRKRRGFEMKLVRRVANKNDFLKYAGYEMELERLRKKRMERLKIAKSGHDHAKRQIHIFERAVGKFKGDVGLWMEYFELAKREGARRLASRVIARAVQLHPQVGGLYILGARHELEHLCWNGARTLLQRGIRMNRQDKELWIEYLKMEERFEWMIKERWKRLGIEEKEIGVVSKVVEEAGVEFGSGVAHGLVMSIW